MQNKLPADPSSLILGIVGLVIGLAGCCCYGISAIIPLTLSIVGLVMANKSLKLYRANPSEYTESSKSNVSNGKVLNIIAIVLNSIFILIVIGALAFVGFAGLQGAFDDIRDNPFENSNDWEYEDDFDAEDDFNYDDRIELEEIDPIEEDSLSIEEVLPEIDTIN